MQEEGINKYSCSRPRHPSELGSRESRRVQVPSTTPLRACLPHPQITQLTLQSMTITEDTLKDLQLQQCSQLQHLKVDRYNVCCSGDNTQHMLSQWLPPTLTTLHEGMWITSTMQSPIRLLLTTNLIQFSTWRLDDALLDALQHLPRLTHVTASDLSISWDFRSSQLRWKRLDLPGDCDLRELAKLPVQNMEQIRVIKKLSRGRDDDGAEQKALVTHLTACPNLQLVPVVRTNLDFPILHVSTDSSEELLSLILSSCAVKPFGLHLDLISICTNSGLFSWGEWAACLQLYPMHVTALSFPLHNPSGRWQTLRRCKLWWEPVVASLPTQITTLAVSMFEQPASHLVLLQALAEVLAAHTTASTVQLLVLFPHSPATDRIDLQRQLQQLADRHSGRVILRPSDHGKFN